MNQALATKQRDHILTIVLEDYFQVGTFQHLIPRSYWGRFETRLRHNTGKVLELLEQTNSRATFFTCGWIAENHPGVLTEIIRAGHEVACQGYYHYAINELTEQEFTLDLLRSRNAVEDATGRAVHGFRIGRHWIGEKDVWALDTLAENGFSYDSSLCRIGREFWNEPFRSSVHLHQGRHGSIHEIAISSLPMWRWSMPISGGNYLRQFPQWPLKQSVKKWVRENNEPLVLYFHTWEIDHEQPKITAADTLQQLRHYRNLSSMTNKVQHYLETYRFSSIAEYLKLDAAQPPQPASPAATNSQLSDVLDQATTPPQAQPLTLVIPCFNEADTLPYLQKTLDRFALKSQGIFVLHYVMVDDGSSDNTGALLKEFFDHKENCTLLRHETNRGIAAGILTGINATQTELLAVLDADCTFSPNQLLEMIALLTEDVDVVAASPAHKQGAMRNVSFWRALLSRGSAFLYRCVLRHKLTSYTSCFRLYRREAVAGIKLYNSGFCGVTEILGRLDLAGYQIREYPAVLEVRLLGASKINVMKTTWDHLHLIFCLAAQRWLNRPLPERAEIG